MNPIEPSEAYGADRLVWKGNSEDVEDLIVRFDRASQESVSLWSLSFNERQAILDGANILLVVTGRHPPVRLAVQGVFE